MKKEVKTEITKEKIFNAALDEFGQNGYQNTSLNNICKKYGISKGLIYHNYKNKQALYICCVKYAVESFISYMKMQKIGADIQLYMKHRFLFFNDNTAISRLIFEMLLQPPNGFDDEFEEIRNNFNEFNLSLYKQVIDNLHLRDGVTKTEAVEYYSMVQTMLNSYMSSLYFTDNDTQKTFLKHEEMLEKMLKYMLYGIANEKNLQNEVLL